MPLPALLLKRHADTLALLLALMIALLSLTPAEQLPELGSSDKLAHLLAYALLGLLATLRRRLPTAVVLTVLAIVAYGALIELLQPYVGRFMDSGDFIANAIGALAGAGMATWLRRLALPVMTPDDPR